MSSNPQGAGASSSTGAPPAPSPPPPPSSPPAAAFAAFFSAICLAFSSFLRAFFERGLPSSSRVCSGRGPAASAARRSEVRQARHGAGRRGQVGDTRKGATRTARARARVESIAIRMGEARRVSLPLLSLSTGERLINRNVTRQNIFYYYY
eukprot:scaffold87479_cov33-Tisochrysis_lutea.AAC.2